MLKFLSGIWSGKTGAILFLAIAAGTFGGAYYITNKLTDMSSSLQSLSNRNEQLEKTVGNLQTEIRNRDRNTTNYITNLAKNQEDLDGRISKLDAARAKEGVVAAKPKLATKVAKDKVNEFQERLSCVTGNMDSCSRLQLSHPGVQNGQTQVAQ